MAILVNMGATWQIKQRNHFKGFLSVNMVIGYCDISEHLPWSNPFSHTYSYLENYPAIMDKKYFVLIADIWNNQGVIIFPALTSKMVVEIRALVRTHIPH